MTRNTDLFHPFPTPSQKEGKGQAIDPFPSSPPLGGKREGVALDRDFGSTKKNLLPAKREEVCRKI